MSLVLSTRLDAITLAGRKRRGRGQVLNRADHRSRLVKFVLGGVVIPIAVLAAGTRLQLPNHQTPLAMAIRLRRAARPGARAEDLAGAVLRAQSPSTKAAGIEALADMRSPEALAQLLRVMSTDADALKGGRESRALSKALADYGPEARAALVQALQALDARARATAAAREDTFDEYLSADFASLERAIAARPVSMREKDDVEAAGAELKRALAAVDGDERSSLPAFVLRTFLEMDPKRDPALLPFARQTAADAGWSDPVRGQAVLLVGKAGGKDELDALYGYLDDASPILQARAVEAIALVQQSERAAPASH
jgi:hypothetical protein